MVEGALAMQAAQEEHEAAEAEAEVTNIPGWTPSVTLEVRDNNETGEEEERELYSQRSKLYRFRENEWKERGLGDAKLLQHRESGRVRFIMRQEKTMKIVANHYVIDLAPYCSLKPNAGSTKCWVWTAQDNADDELAVEQFALKFGTPELATVFEEEFNRAKELTSRAGGFPDFAAQGEDDAASKDAVSATQPLATTPAAATNTGTIPSGPQKEPSATVSAATPDKKPEDNPFAGLSFFGGAGSGSSPGTGGSLFSDVAASSSSSSGPFSTLTFSGPMFGGSPQSSGGGLFGSAATSPPTATQSSGGLFGSAAASPPTATQSSSGAPPLRPSETVQAPDRGQEEDEYVAEEEVVTVPGWTPSVTLEVQDKVLLGEEEEEQLYSQRAKLYRFRDGEWKERGLGEAKLLQHQTTGIVRFLLRQEKTLKIVANHVVADAPPYCDLKPNAGSDKFWVWSAQDYSEDEMQVETLALKFGTPELATAFKVAFEAAKNAGAATAAAGSTVAAEDKVKQRDPQPVLAKESAGEGEGTILTRGIGGISEPASGGHLPVSSDKQSSSVAGSLRLTIVSARGLRDADWVPGAGKSDPYCVCEIAGKPKEAKLQTKVISDKVDPVWEHHGELPGFKGGDTLVFSVYDKDLARSQLLGTLHLESAKFYPHGFEGELPLSDAGKGIQAYLKLKIEAPPLQLTIVSARGLRDADWVPGSGKSDPYCICEIAGKPKEAKLQTKVISDKLDPVWEHHGELPGFRAGDALIFTVYDKDVARSQLLGTLRLESAKFYPHGFDGELPLADAGKGIQAYLKLKIQVSPAASKVTEEQDEDTLVQEEEEVTQVPGWTPSVTLEVKDKVETGEEEESELYSQRAKLYRFRDHDWKERGLGEAKFLQHNLTGKVRFMLRQEKTMKIVANHWVLDVQPYCNLQPNAGSEKCWTWMAQDCSDDEIIVETFALKFGATETAAKFKDEFNKAKDLNSKCEGFGELIEAHAELAELGRFGDENIVTPEPVAPVNTNTQAQSPELKPLVQPASPTTGGSPTLAVSGSLFGASTGGSIFSNSASSGAKIFGGGTGASIFGGDTASAGTSTIFGTSTSASAGAGTGASIFGGSASSGTSNISGTGNRLFGDNTGSSLFGGSSGTGLLGAKTEPGWLFGSSTGSESLFGAKTGTGTLGNSSGTGTLLGGASSSGTGIFGSLNTTTGSLFGTSPGTSSSLFSGTGGSSLFGASPGTSSSLLMRSSGPGSVIFGGSLSSGSKAPSATVGTSGTLFGGGSTNGGLFGASLGSTGGSLFGGTSGSSLFGESSSSGSSSSTASSASATGSSSLFGGSSSSTSATGSSLFGGSSMSSGGSFLGGSSGHGSLSSMQGGGLFGSSSTFSVGVTPATAASKNDTAPATLGASPQQAADDDQYVAEEEVTTVPGWVPSVTLEVKEQVMTGEEEEDELFSQRSKLYRYRDGEWKERGTGEAKLLKHPKTRKVRFLMRQEKTLKIVANHCVIDRLPYCDLRPNAGNMKTWVWTAQDCADGDAEVEQFALKFTTTELAETFYETFTEAKRSSGTEAQAPANEEDAAAEEVDEDYGDYGEYGDYDEVEVVEDYFPQNAGEDVPNPLARIAAMQNQGGWRCPVCRTQWGDSVFVCGACEAPRPGYEDKVKKKQQQGLNLAAAAFLGASAGNALTASAQTKPSEVVVPPRAATLQFGNTSSPSSGPTPLGVTSIASATGAGLPTSTIFGAAAKADTLTAASGQSVFGGTAATVAPPLFGLSGSVPCQPASMGQNISEQWFGAPSFGMQSSPVLGGPTPVMVPPPPPPPHSAATEQPTPGNVAGAGTCWPGAIGVSVAAQEPGPPYYRVPTNTAGANSSEMHGRALDAAMLKAIEDAVAAAHSRVQQSHMPSGPTAAPMDHSNYASRSGQSDTSTLERLREEIRDCREHISRSEERARKAEERTRRLEDELGDAKQQLDEMRQQQRRRQQDEGNSSQMLREEMQTLRRDLQQQVQLLKQQISDDRLLMSNVQRDLDQERHLRCSLETRVSENSGTLQEVLKVFQNALRVAESAQQDVRQLRQEKNSDEDRLAEAVKRVERSTRERLDALECKMEKGHLDLMRTHSTPTKINFLQGLHAMQTGRRFGGGSNGAALKDYAEADAHQSSEGAARPLLRCIP